MYHTHCESVADIPIEDATKRLMDKNDWREGQRIVELYGLAQGLSGCQNCGGLSGCQKCGGLSALLKVSIHSIVYSARSQWSNNLKDIVAQFFNEFQGDRCIPKIESASRIAS